MKKPKAPKAPDPKEIIAAQAQANRVNVNTPFGSQTYATGADGRTELNTSYSPEMQALAQRAMSLAGKDSTRYQMPPGMENIMGGIMNKVGGRYGQGGNVGDAVANSGGRKQSPAQTMPAPQNIAPGEPLNIPAKPMPMPAPTVMPQQGGFKSPGSGYGGPRRFIREE